MQRHHARPSTVLVALVLAMALAPHASAWGPIGHRAVGLIAEHHLTPQAERAVADLLAPERLAYVTTWADEIRSEPEWAKADPLALRDDPGRADL